MARYAELSLKFVLLVLCVTALLNANSRSERAFAIVVPEKERDIVAETKKGFHWRTISYKVRVDSFSNFTNRHALLTFHVVD